MSSITRKIDDNIAEHGSLEKYMESLEDENRILNFKYRAGKREIFPAYKKISNWVFDTGEEAEATLAHFMAIIAEKNGLTHNDLMHIFPLVLRMLKSKSKWTE